MKMRKFAVWLLAAAIFLTLCAGCAQTQEPAPGDSAPATTDGGQETPQSDGEIKTIEVWMMDQGGTGTGSKVEMVEDAINDLTREKIGVEVNFTWASMGDYPTQLSLAVTNGEQVDVAVTSASGAAAFISYYAKGMCMDITDLLQSQGQGLLDLIPETYFLPYTYDGAVYGIPTWRILNSDYFLCMRQDVLEEAGVLEQAQAVTSWSEYEEVMQAVLDKTGISPIVSDIHGMFGECGAVFGADKFADCYTYDKLGDTYYLVYADDQGNVSNLWENPDWINQCKMVNDWAAKGYLYPDSIITAEDSAVIIAQKAAASYVCQSEYGVEVNKTQAFGTPAVCVNLAQSDMNSYYCTKIGAFVPTSSKEPEAAVAFLNLCYTDPELANLICWGIEGETYVVKDGEACYPEGTDMSTCGYHSYDWAFGNQFLTLPWEGLGADFREKSAEYFANVPESPFLGIKVPVQDYDNLLAAIAAVQEEYHKQLSCGMYSDTLYDEYMAKLDSAGLEDYLNIFRTEVDNWLAGER